MITTAKMVEHCENLALIIHALEEKGASLSDEHEEMWSDSTKDIQIYYEEKKNRRIDKKD